MRDEGGSDLRHKIDRMICIVLVSCVPVERLPDDPVPNAFYEKTSVNPAVYVSPSGLSVGFAMGPVAHATGSWLKRGTTWLRRASS